MLEFAWAILQDNVHIVEWVACVLTGEGASRHRDPGGFLLDFAIEVFTFGAGEFRTLGECLSEKIRNRTNDEPTFRFERMLPDDTGFSTLTGLSGGTISIRVDHFRWEENYFGKFIDAPAGSGEQFCIVADLAATILHEMVHTCLAGASANGDLSGQCELSYLVENCFRFMLGERYPCLLNRSGSCSFYGDLQLWLDDLGNYPGDPSFTPSAERYAGDARGSVAPIWPIFAV